ncbi:MAG: hypothetical protein KatS3mg109_0742 [Pirellulaceae bacterium]|nr:MAG: hypothetical protein KatS3mg109_0742 [Pirellulaceae bacterium]
MLALAVGQRLAKWAITASRRSGTATSSVTARRPTAAAEFSKIFVLAP